MRWRLRLFRASSALPFLLCLSVLCCLGQQPSPEAVPQSDVVVPSISGVFIPPLPHAPFSATVEVLFEETLPDGSSLVLRTMNHIARDDAGRTFTDKRRLVSTSFKDEPPLLSAQIYDPATGMLSRLDPYTRIARQSTLAAPPSRQRARCPSFPTKPGRMPPTGRKIWEPAPLLA